MISLPKSPNQYSLPEWNQKNDSDVNGSLWASTGIDLSENEGKLRLGKRTILATGTVDDSDMTDYPVAYKTFMDNSSNLYNWTIMGGFIWKNYIQGTQTATKDTHSVTPIGIDSSISDMEIFNSELYVTGNTLDAYYLTSSASSWATVSNLGVGGNSSSFTIYQNRLYCGGGTKVNSMDTSHTVASSGAFSVSIPDQELTITFLRASSNRIWIGTANFNNGKGYIYEWDGTATQVTKSYRLESAGAMSCVIKDDIPYVMDANGKLIAWNGGTFTEIGRLNRRENKILFNSSRTSIITNRFIHKNGMALIQGKINLLIKGTNADGTMEETIPSGIWEYDPNRGLTHKHSISTAKIAGTIQDYGQLNIKNAGALSEFNSTTSNGFFAGVSYYSDATTVKAGIFYNDFTDVLQKAGSFVTTKQYAMDSQGNPSVQNVWQNLYILYRKLLNSADEIVVKYRVTEVEPLTATITWTSTTTFTVPVGSLDVSLYWSAGVGGEVEILNGIGAGKCSHITNAVANGIIWTVTVDEIYTGATGTAIARFQSWKKLGEITYSNPTPNGITFDQEGMGDVSNWIQFKVWMLFTGRDEIEKLLLVNENFNPAN